MSDSKETIVSENDIIAIILRSDYQSKGIGFVAISGGILNTGTLRFRIFGSYGFGSYGFVTISGSSSDRS